MTRRNYRGAEAIDNAQYMAFKQSVQNDRSIITSNVQAKDIALIDKQTVRFSGHDFKLAEGALASLIKVLRLPESAYKLLMKQLGEDTTVEIIKVLTQALVSDAELRFVLSINKTTDRIVGFTKSKDQALSKNAYFDLFERTVNKNPSMVIKNLAVTENGSIEIAVTNSNWEFEVPGLSDEVFHSGLVFVNTPTTTIINPFNERLVCTNGMVVAEKGMSIILTNKEGNREKSVQAFFEAVANVAQNGNFENEFKTRIGKMMRTQASYAELLHMRDVIHSEVNIEKNDTITMGLLEAFMPVNEMKKMYLEQKIDLNDPKYKTSYKKIRTMLTVWELVNKTTDLASHPARHGFFLRDNDYSVLKLQRSAGMFAFKKEYDLECQLPQVF